MEWGHVPTTLQALSSVVITRCKEETLEILQTAERSALCMQFDQAIV